MATLDERLVLVQRTLAQNPDLRRRVDEVIADIMQTDIDDVLQGAPPLRVTTAAHDGGPRVFADGKGGFYAVADVPHRAEVLTLRPTEPKPSTWQPGLMLVKGGKGS